MQMHDTSIFFDVTPLQHLMAKYKVMMSSVNGVSYEHDLSNELANPFASGNYLQKCYIYLVWEQKTRHILMST